MCIHAGNVLTHLIMICERIARPEYDHSGP